MLRTLLRVAGGLAAAAVFGYLAGLLSNRSRGRGPRYAAPRPG